MSVGRFNFHSPAEKNNLQSYDQFKQTGSAKLTLQPSYPPAVSAIPSNFRLSSPVFTTSTRESLRSTFLTSALNANNNPGLNISNLGTTINPPTLDHTSRHYAPQDYHSNIFSSANITNTKPLTPGIIRPKISRFLPNLLDSIPLLEPTIHTFEHAVVPSLHPSKQLRVGAVLQSALLKNNLKPITSNQDFIPTDPLKIFSTKNLMRAQKGIHTLEWGIGTFESYHHTRHHGLSTANALTVSALSSGAAMSTNTLLTNTFFHSHSAPRLSGSYLAKSLGKSILTSSVATSLFEFVPNYFDLRDQHYSMSNSLISSFSGTAIGVTTGTVGLWLIKTSIPMMGSGVGTAWGSTQLAIGTVIVLGSGFVGSKTAKAMASLNHSYSNYIANPITITDLFEAKYESPNHSSFTGERFYPPILCELKLGVEKIKSIKSDYPQLHNVSASLFRDGLMIGNEIVTHSTYANYVPRILSSINLKSKASNFYGGDAFYVARNGYSYQEILGVERVIAFSLDRKAKIFDVLKNDFFGTRIDPKSFKIYSHAERTGIIRAIKECHIDCIKYPSRLVPSGVNYAVINNPNTILKPIGVYPVPIYDVEEAMISNYYSRNTNGNNFRSMKPTGPNAISIPTIRTMQAFGFIGTAYGLYYSANEIYRSDNPIKEAVHQGILFSSVLVGSKLAASAALMPCSKLGISYPAIAPISVPVCMATSAVIGGAVAATASDAVWKSNKAIRLLTNLFLPTAVSANELKPKCQRPYFEDANTAFQEVDGYANFSKIGDVIGGQVKKNFDAGFFQNACAIRGSRLFNAPHIKSQVNCPIPKIKGETVTGGDGLQYIYRVQTLIKFLKQAWGPPDYDSRKDRFKPIETHGAVIYLMPEESRHGYTGHFEVNDNMNSFYRDEAVSILFWHLPRKKVNAVSMKQDPQNRQIGRISNL